MRNDGSCYECLVQLRQYHAPVSIQRVALALLIIAGTSFSIAAQEAPDSSVLDLRGSPYSMLTAKVTGDGLRVRKQPSLNAPILTLLKAGTEVEITAVQKPWAYVFTFEDPYPDDSPKHGWVHLDYLHCDQVGNISQLIDSPSTTLDAAIRQMGFRTAVLPPQNQFPRPPPKFVIGHPDAWRFYTIPYSEWLGMFDFLKAIVVPSEQRSDTQERLVTLDRTPLFGLHEVTGDFKSYYLPPPPEVFRCHYIRRLASSELHKSITNEDTDGSANYEDDYGIKGADEAWLEFTVRVDSSGHVLENDGFEAIPIAMRKGEALYLFQKDPFRRSEFGGPMSAFCGLMFQVMGAGITRKVLNAYYEHLTSHYATEPLAASVDESHKWPGTWHFTRNDLHSYVLTTGISASRHERSTYEVSWLILKPGDDLREEIEAGCLSLPSKSQVNLDKTSDYILLNFHSYHAYSVSGSEWIECTEAQNRLFSEAEDKARKLALQECVEMFEGRLEDGVCVVDVKASEKGGQ